MLLLSPLISGLSNDFYNRLEGSMFNLSYLYSISTTYSGVWRRLFTVLTRCISTDMLFKILFYRRTQERHILCTSPSEHSVIVVRHKLVVYATQIFTVYGSSYDFLWSTGWGPLERPRVEYTKERVYTLLLPNHWESSKDALVSSWK